MNIFVPLGEETLAMEYEFEDVLEYICGGVPKKIRTKKSPKSLANPTPGCYKVKLWGKIYYLCQKNTSIGS